MDRQSIARLMTSSKAPLGAVGVLLELTFKDEQRAVRQHLADEYKALVEETVEDYQRDYPHLRMDTIQRQIAYSRTQYPPVIVKLLAPPGRCTEPRTGGRCRGVPHRFATFVQCPLHHR